MVGKLEGLGCMCEGGEGDGLKMLSLGSCNLGGGGGEFEGFLGEGTPHPPKPECGDGGGGGGGGGLRSQRGATL